MSLSAHSGVPVPEIAYCILHQSGPDVPRETYLKTLQEFHTALAEESRTLAAAYARAVREGTEREAQSLRSALAHFLETPIRSDAEEVRKTLADALERIGGHSAEFPGLRYTLEGRALSPSPKNAAERRLLQQGRDHLAALGFGVSRTDPPVHESVFVVTGGAGLDLLEWMVRDRLGISGGAHGSHLGQFRRTSYAAYNLVHAAGALPPGERIPVCLEAALAFAKPDMTYEDLRVALAALTEDLARTAGAEHVTAWQRKLGLGAGVEFVLRIVSPSAETTTGSLQWLAGATLAGPLRRALVQEGRLVLKELVFSA